MNNSNDSNNRQTYAAASEEIFYFHRPERQSLCFPRDLTMFRHQSII
jgi:hypothetical protein